MHLSFLLFLFFVFVIYEIWGVAFAILDKIVDHHRAEIAAIEEEHGKRE